MSITTTDPTDLETAVGAYADRLFATGIAALEAATIALGRELGLYEQLGAADSTTPVELAERAGIAPRYAREWLEQQAAAGLIEVIADDDDADARGYALSPAAQECLLRPESLASVGPLFDLLPAVGRVHTALIEAFQTGTGVPYADYAIHDAQGDFNRPAFLNLLTTDWLPQVPGAIERLTASPARVAEIGCGEGWAAIAIAKTWPDVEVDGFDNDEASIAAARRHAADNGVGDRVHFELVDVTRELPSRVDAGTYDLVLAFEMVHDLARPRDALRAMRNLGKTNAIILVVDEKVGERFEASTENPVERLMYAASVLHCLPVGMVDPESAGTGTVMRPSTLKAYAADAGFSSVDVLPIEHDLFRFYHLI
jgi:2-polyprenyl-3-methyl-5-hydroxy-6-metoxy-1,4-benzoquinol methylase